MNWGALVSLELQVLAGVLPPLTLAAVAAGLRWLRAHVRSRAVQAYVTQLVAWAQQAIPDKGERYAQVATLLSRRFPGLKSADMEVLIESEVHALKSGLSAVGEKVPDNPPAPAVVVDGPVVDVGGAVPTGAATVPSAPGQPAAGGEVSGASAPGGVG